MKHLSDIEADGRESMDVITEENSPPVCRSCGEVPCRCEWAMPPGMKAKFKYYNDQF